MKKLALVMFVMLIAAPVSAATVNLAWDANTEPDLTGYKLYRGTVRGGPYSLAATVGKVTTWSDVGLADGFYCWVATATDSSNESGYSNEVCLQVDTTPPSAPKTLRILGVVK